MKYVENFYEWAKSMYRAYLEYLDLNKHTRLYIDDKTKTTLICDFKNKRSAFSTCYYTDEYNTIVGIGVAYAKLIGEEIPIERKKVYVKELKSGDNFIIVNTSKPGRFYTVVGVNPLNPYEIVIVDNKTNIPSCINRHCAVYKID